uniref:penicillin-binding transpeptidase domain-containing protein n=1 Tax=Candidatus Fimivicinus sp. TaxID=3056640 RepID=UPI003FEDC8D9
MRITSKRALAIYALIGAFLIGVVFLIGGFVLNGETWALKRFNQHLFTGGSLTSAGTIYDTKGTILAQTKNGERVFNDSSRIRKATLHMVGDTAGYISTGIHTIFRSELTGYNLIDGVYRLKEDGEGNNITLTLNAQVCATALDALGDRKGTVGVYNYKTGEILCMVSSPTYDPERKPTDIDTDKMGKYDGIYLNRFLSGVYTPGSTFKTITAISAIDNIPDIFTQKFTCKGKMQTNGGVIYCNEKNGHGTLTFEQALNKSCNVAFAQIALQLGAEKLTATAEQLGFNQAMQMDGINIAISKFDLSGADERGIGQAGLGQHTTLVNPYHMLTIMGAIANGGTPVTPYVVKSITTPGGLTLKKGSANTGKAYLSSSAASKMVELMRSNTVHFYSDSRFPSGMQICGKTGTGEVGGDKAPHAWFVGFSQNPATPYAFVVVVENGGSGYQQAIPIANKVLTAIRSAS